MITPATEDLGAAAFPGDVVRELFDRNELELEELVAELEEARRAADTAEARVRAHPALGLLTPDEVAVLVPADREPEPAGPAQDPARTTVVRRPPAPSGAGPGGPAGPDDDLDPRSPVARIVTSQWIWKVGVAVVVVALLLLKFG